MARAFGVAADVEATGQLNAWWESTGGLDNASSTLTLRDGHVVWQGLPPVEGLAIDASFDGTIVAVDSLQATWQGGGIEGRARIPRALLATVAAGSGRAPPGRVDLTLTGLTQEALRPWLPADTVNSIDARVSATLGLDLATAEVSGISGTLVLDRSVAHRRRRADHPSPPGAHVDRPGRPLFRRRGVRRRRPGDVRRQHRLRRPDHARHDDHRHAQPASALRALAAALGGRPGHVQPLPDRPGRIAADHRTHRRRRRRVRAARSARHRLEHLRADSVRRRPHLDSGHLRLDERREPRCQRAGHARRPGGDRRRDCVPGPRRRRRVPGGRGHRDRRAADVDPRPGRRRRADAARRRPGPARRLPWHREPAGAGRLQPGAGRGGRRLRLPRRAAPRHRRVDRGGPGRRQQLRAVRGRRQPAADGYGGPARGDRPRRPARGRRDFPARRALPAQPQQHLVHQPVGDRAGSGHLDVHALERSRVHRDAQRPAGAPRDQCHVQRSRRQREPDERAARRQLAGPRRDPGAALGRAAGGDRTAHRPRQPAPGTRLRHRPDPAGSRPDRRGPRSVDPAHHVQAAALQRRGDPVPGPAAERRPVGGGQLPAGAQRRVAGALARQLGPRVHGPARAQFRRRRRGAVGRAGVGRGLGGAVRWRRRRRGRAAAAAAHEARRHVRLRGLARRRRPPAGVVSRAAAPRGAGAAVAGDRRRWLGRAHLSRDGRARDGAGRDRRHPAVEPAPPPR